MPHPHLPPRGIFIPIMMVYNREPPPVDHTWIQLPGLPLLKSSIAVIVFIAPLLAVRLASFPQPL